MGKRGIVIGVISIVLVLYGLIYSIFNKTFCKGICSECINTTSLNCTFIFIFVGIIFIVSGTSLYATYRDIEAINQDFTGSKRLKKFIDSENKTGRYN